MEFEDFFGLLERSPYTSAMFDDWPSCRRFSSFSSAFLQILRWASISKVSMDFHAAIPFLINQHRTPYSKNHQITCFFQILPFNFNQQLKISGPYLKKLVYTILTFIYFCVIAIRRTSGRSVGFLQRDPLFCIQN
jgi:hypothetical protein